MFATGRRWRSTASSTCLPEPSSRLRAPDDGMRYYVAVRGGLEIEPVLGSRSFDTLAGLGPAPVDRRPHRRRPGSATRRSRPTSACVHRSRTTMIHLFAGPRRDWFTPEAWTALTTQPFVVSPSGNRVGARLSGPALERVAVS